MRLVSQTDFCVQLRERGYNWMFVTAKTGAIINGQKVSRSFFKTLNQWGQMILVLWLCTTHSSEGITAKAQAVLFMRNMDYIVTSQSIGRVIRLLALKTFGLVCVPVFDKVASAPPGGSGGC